MTAAGFVAVALILTGGGLLLSRASDDQSAGAQVQSSQQPIAWETVMKWLSHRAHRFGQ
jgi:hypothetical protein